MDLSRPKSGKDINRASSAMEVVEENLNVDGEKLKERKRLVEAQQQKKSRNRFVYILYSLISFNPMQSFSFQISFILYQLQANQLKREIKNT